MVVDYFTSIPSARVRTFVCADVAEQLAAIELARLGETFNKQKGSSGSRVGVFGPF
jgi:hypothetical protein